MNRADREWLNAQQASELLGVRRETLYAYASRGHVRVRREGSVRVYARIDLESLKVRSQARRGHAAVAASALRFGEPVLDTRVSSISAEGPRYRGHLALTLAREQVSAERVSELLWTSELPQREPSWPRATRSDLPSVRRARRGELSPTSSMLLVLARYPADSPLATERPLEAELDRARQLLRLLAAAPSIGRGADAVERALGAKTLASALLAGLCVRSTPRVEAAVNRALVLMADHELNASTFVARVAASAGADTPRALLAGISTLSGGRHGGMCDRLDAVLDGFAEPEQALTWVRAELASGRALPGFGHPLYAQGDPRAAPLFADSAEFGGRNPRVRTIQVAREAMQLAGGEPATADLGLVALTAALELPRGAAGTIFALARSIGYVAHVLEQREQGFLLRPRAHYVGV